MLSKSISGGNEGTVPPSDEVRRGAVWPRIVSAVALAVPAAAAVFAGAPWYQALVALVAGVMAWEWTRICAGNFGPAGAVLVASTLLVVIAVSLARYDLALIAIGASALTVFIVARLTHARGPAWLAAGVLYMGVPIVAIIWLYGDTTAGRNIVVWLILAVAATDIGAYYSGRTIGGPRLAPRVSPNKTWAGLVGGMVSAAVTGVVCAGLIDELPIWLAALAGAAVALVAQGGDLLESIVKRRFDIKDSSGIIPGHGGLLDRMDGLVATVTVFGSLKWMIGGRLLTWQSV